MGADGSLFGSFRERVIVDLFAGGGGASEGIRMATGQCPTVAINHDADAIRMHEANHPRTIHYQESVFDVRPQLAARGRRVDLLWASPACTHFSRARGGATKSEQSRSLAWVVVDWARAVAPRVIACENVEEWLTWGPLGENGEPIADRKGETWREWVGALQAAGYRVEWRTLNAADYGAPTSRKRLFVAARNDGAPIEWPTPTHGPGRLPYRTAAECIDWSIPCPSIFDRARPLAEATQRRIAAGIVRYVLRNPRPFIVANNTNNVPRDIGEPVPTITTGNRNFLVSPLIAKAHSHGWDKGAGPIQPGDRPMWTVTTKDGSALVAAFLAKHYGGVVGQSLDRPTGTITSVDHHALVAATLIETRNGERPGQAPRARDIERPLGTITALGSQGALVAAFLTKFYGQGGQWQGLDKPLDTIVTKDRFGLVTVDLGGEPWAIVDIGMRMLQPRELATAQGFPASYVLTGTKSAQVARIGNSVSPPVAAALVRSLLRIQSEAMAAK